MRNTTKFSLVASSLVVACTVALAPSQAHAKKPGVLEKKPIVENKIELRKLRFQVTPRAGITLSQPYVHQGLAGAELRFDFLDFLGVRVTGAYAVLGVESAVLDDLNGGSLPVGLAVEGTAAPEGCEPGLPCRQGSDQDNPAALLGDFRAGLTELRWQASADVTFTPLAGKLGMFSSIFTEYDLYLFGGLGVTAWERRYPTAPSTSELYGIENSTDPDGVDPNTGESNYCELPAGLGNAGTTNNECLLHPVKADDGIRVGPSFGAGLHLFMTDWMSMNLEVQDIMVKQNIVGLNATVEDPLPVVNKADRVWTHNVSTTIGLTFYLPPRAKRTFVGRPTNTMPVSAAASTNNPDPTEAPLTEEAPVAETDPEIDDTEEVLSDDDDELELSDDE